METMPLFGIAARPKRKAQTSALYIGVIKASIDLRLHREEDEDIIMINAGNVKNGLVDG